MFGKSVWAVALAASLPAQYLIPAKAGLVSYADEAYIEDGPVNISPTDFLFVTENGVLRTGAGRAEVLLGPCAAMWIDEKSSFRMLSSALSDIRIEVLTGSAIVAAGAMARRTKLTLLLKTSVAPLDHKGAYHFDAEPPRVEVLSGRTTVQWADQRFSVTAGRWLALDALASVRKFAKLNPDPLEKWSNGRAALLARLSNQQTVKVQEPAPPVMQNDPDNNKGVPGLPGDTSASIPQLPPMPSVSLSGCGVAAWANQNTQLPRAR